MSYLESVLLEGESGQRCNEGEGERDADEHSASSSSEAGGVEAVDWHSGGGDEEMSSVCSSC